MQTQDTRRDWAGLPKLWSPLRQGELPFLFATLRAREIEPSSLYNTSLCWPLVLITPGWWSQRFSNGHTKNILEPVSRFPDSIRYLFLKLVSLKTMSVFIILSLLESIPSLSQLNSGAIAPNAEKFPGPSSQTKGSFNNLTLPSINN